MNGDKSAEVVIQICQEKGLDYCAQWVNIGNSIIRTHTGGKDPVENLI